MSKREEINGAMKEALKNKDKTALATIRLILAALKDRDIAARAKGSADGLNDDEILSLLQSMIKQRRESIKMYEEAERMELAEREGDEIKVIESFLPQQLSAEELSELITKLIADTGAESIKDMGKVMAVLKSNYAGQVDMGKAGALVKQQLG